MELQQREKWYQCIGIGMFVWLFSVINFVDLRFVEYFSCFAFGLIALGFVLKLRYDFLNLLTISYLVVSVYLLARQAIWVGTYGLDANFTYQEPAMEPFPWWIHVVMHGFPVPLVFVVMEEKKTEVTWKNFAIFTLILVTWSYTIDAERFLGIVDFYIAYPLGIPLTVVYLFIYQKYLLPRIMIKGKGKENTVLGNQPNKQPNN
ncbi:MAG: hypothetical protein ACTSUE_26770 [Promethearchaeota archaeon]